MTLPRPLPESTPPAPSSETRFVCVHGHFYQPPRENPWLETVEVQESAAPYHDWNDRITAECYAPNGASRITNDEDQIVRIVNNYARMSFNFGPTLLSWLAANAPRTYRMILDADTASAARYSGHGSAIAQVYNHIIMPLATPRDARTQILWGIADFESRFHRKPEGMWLAETAVNREVLDLLAQQGIRLTLLAPNQCARTRPLAADPAAPASAWLETPDATVDPSQPYLVSLNEGRSIAVFFYNGPNSRAIAFEGLLNSGQNFADRLLAGLTPQAPRDPARHAPPTPQLSHVATDGESYGHHHKHGEMALASAMHLIEDQHHARLTNYAEFLAAFPPTHQAEVAEDTSWSCSHGVERWRSDCGCNGGKVGWNQKWRGPLRDALDFLRDAAAPLSEALAQPLLKDLWSARDAYIHVVLDRSPTSTARFFSAHAVHPLSPAERTTVLELLELQRHTQLMYTSCGWFFDEISGIETIQIIAYAGRVLQLAAKLFGPPGAALQTRFLELLAEAQSNVPEIGDGAEVFRRYVTPMRIGLEEVGAHYAISSMFRAYPEVGELFCFDLHRDSHEVFTSGRGRVALGRARVRSRITEEIEEICFAVLHLGDQNLSAAVRRYTSADAGLFDAFSADLRQSIRRANLPEVIRAIDAFFGHTAAPPLPSPSTPQTPDPAHIPASATTPASGTAPDHITPGATEPATAAQPVPRPPTAYSLTSLFADEQHRILRSILNTTLSEMEDSLRKIYEDHASLLHFLTESGMAAPPALALAASFALNASLRRAFETESFDSVETADLLARAVADQVPLDTVTLSFAAGQRMKRAMIRLEAAAAGHSPTAPPLANALSLAHAIRSLPFEVNLWQAQNIWNDLLRRSDSNYWTPEWKEGFKALGQSLNIAVDRLVIEEGVTAF